MPMQGLLDSGLCFIGSLLIGRDNFSLECLPQRLARNQDLCLRELALLKH